MGVSMYQDSKSGVWILQWGGRRGRKFFWTGKRDRAAARVLLDRKEQELALVETGDLERRISETVAARFEQSIDQIVEARVQTALVERAKALSATNGKPLPDTPVTTGISEYVEANEAAGNSDTHVENIERQLSKFSAHARIERVCEFRPEHLTRYLADTREVEGLGDKTVSDRHQIITKWLDWMANPVTLQPKKAAKRRVEYYTLEDYRKILDQAAQEPNRRAPVLASLALFGGFRASELFRMDHQDIRFDEREIDVGQGVVTTKTRRSRVMPILDQMLEPLMTLRGGTGRVFDCWQDRWAFGDYFQGLVSRATGRKAGLLVARHSTITWLVHAGLSLAKTAQWCGNSARTIEKTYLALVPDVAEPVRLSYCGMPLEPGGLPRVQRSQASRPSDDQRKGGIL